MTVMPSSSVASLSYYGDPPDVLPDSDDLARGLVAEDLAAGHPVVVPLAVALLGVPVAPAEPAGLDSDDCTVRRRIGCLDGSYCERFAVLLEDCCAHLGSARTVAAGEKNPGDGTAFGGPRPSRRRLFVDPEGDARTAGT
jgi:hypothetical protein